jgi:hypothetical protein
MTDIEVNLSGPLFDGRADNIAAAMCRDMEDDIAAQAYSEVMGNLNRSIRHPTPYYETQIINTRRGGERTINDRGIVYGPWLEGTSSRNRTTRFKGYASFRRARDAMQAKAGALAERVARRYIGRM